MGRDGVVEDRYRQLNPDGFKQICERYGHTHVGDKRNTTYSASMFIASGLGRLFKSGELDGIFGKATGDWAYNGEVSYWAKPPAPPESKRLTYSSTCRRRLDSERAIAKRALRKAI